MGIFQAAGIDPVGAHVVCPDLLPGEGVLSAASPDKNDRADIDLAAEILDQVSDLDIGQSCVVANRLTLAIEAQPGTDHMLECLSEPQAERARAGVFYKAPKRGQDLRADMPTIGPETMRRVAAARLNGVVIQAGAVMVLDLAKTIEIANDAGLFFWVRGQGE